MRRSYKFRLYPTPAQERDMLLVLDRHRHLYNQCLEQRILAYSGYGIGVNYYDQAAWFSAKPKSEYFKCLNVSSAQATMRRLDRAFQNFFGRLKSKKGKPGFPGFKSLDRFNSFLFASNGDGCRLKDGRLRIMSVGNVRVKAHREVLGEIKTLSVKREADKWFVVLSCKLPDVVVPRSTKPAVGIDMGLESFLTTSDGEHVANPRFQKIALPELRIANRRLARRSRGSNRRRKARLVLQKVHSRIANQRRDFIHKLSYGFTRRYGLIAAEGLRVNNMLKNRRLARSISDAAWTAFLGAVRYKVEETGAEFVVVDPRYTSQACSGCGCLVEKSLSVRQHDCPHCGLSLHRDINAARNILFRALARTGPTNAKPTLQHECSPVLAAVRSFEKPLALASG